MKTPSHLIRGRAAMYQITRQFSSSPEEKLMCAIINGAVVDLSSQKHRRAAIQYFKGPMIHAIMGGVEPSWIREVLIAYKLLTPLHFLRRD